MAQSRISEIEGDLFDAPDGAALIHACNCLGAWGAGIAKAFQVKYPAAFKIYRDHCEKYLTRPEFKAVSSSREPSRQVKLPEGTTLIIPPQENDYKKGSKKHWIVCVFTSRGFGKGLSTVDVILENTELAVADMKRQLEDLGQVGELWSCRFNSGLFGVEWKLSRKSLEDADLEVTVVRPIGEKE